MYEIVTRLTVDEGAAGVHDSRPRLYRASVYGFLERRDTRQYDGRAMETWAGSAVRPFSLGTHAALRGRG